MCTLIVDLSCKGLLEDCVCKDAVNHALIDQTNNPSDSFYKCKTGWFKGPNVFLYTLEEME